MDTPASNTEAPPTPSPAPPQIPSASTTATTPAPAPAVASAPIKKQYNKRVNKKKVEGLLAYTTAFVPGTYNVKIPAGDYLQKERNADVARQMSLDRAKREEEELSSKISAAGDGERENPLSKILVIHPGSRNLRLGLASDFYPKEIPNCIARPAEAVQISGARKAPVMGSRVKNLREQHERNKKRKRGEMDEDDGGEEGDVDMGNGDDIGEVYIQEMTHLILQVLGFKSIAVQQEAYCAIFGAGMSSACVVDIGAQETSVTCVDEAMLLAETRVKLNYGGDDITSALTHLLLASNFPYRELDLARSQDWLMMDNLKIKLCTLEEHLVANTLWDFYVPRVEGLTQKWMLRTFDENILAPLIDFDEKNSQGSFRFWNTSDDKVTDEITSAYEEPTSAMKALTTHLLPGASQTSAQGAQKSEAPSNSESTTPAPAPLAASSNASPEKPNASPSTTTLPQTPVPELNLPSTASTPAPAAGSAADAGTPGAAAVAPALLSLPTLASLAPQPTLSNSQIFTASSQSPLDAAIAASLSLCGTENKIRTLSHSILLIGGSSSIKGLPAFISDRLPSLLKQRGVPGNGEVTIVPPPRGLNPRYVSWKGGSVMCNIEGLGDMWIRSDEWEALGVRALKDRYMWF
ncbi:nuclear protein [Cryptococcus deuterogattii 99/473]|uniref:Nuclear protein n=1 Tax=Cryptococcus deuterogattii Ram5 TaxID=1296110 RepID=A0A0D0SY48_9TREE|nr:nuclear protein [Cryptococcus deuterogattii LA55]KIR38077.1 nuclear protein [Cryptococcus deuterogattii Ram5]KIR94389.1 nuclear protein [Cryptococcus deuterogattii CBS 10090]KIY55622.1 nuclear protein [Cryptococcus deuterogattii 99/473]